MPATNDSWRRIRRLRANPPFLAGDQANILERRRVFQSALAQAEELWEAAAAVGAASRPLPLFYSLSQAGRAICAAWTTNENWRPDTHGLSSRGGSEDDVPALPVRVTTAAGGAFPMVADATDSFTFRGTTTVAQLWASLDELPDSPDLVGGSLRPLYLEGASAPPGVEEGQFDFLFPRYATIALPQPARVRAALGDPLTGETSGETIEEVLGDYPTTAGVYVEGVERPRWFRLNAEPFTEQVLSFQGDDGQRRSLEAVGNRTDEQPAPGQGRRYSVRPRIGTGTDRPPSRLMTLWALIYALSQLARYHPEAWVAALNPDSSRIAVDLEQGLDVALLLVPDFLASGISSGSMSRLIRERQAAEEQAQN